MPLLEETDEEDAGGKDVLMADQEEAPVHAEVGKDVDEMPSSISKQAEGTYSAKPGKGGFGHDCPGFLLGLNKALFGDKPPLNPYATMANVLMEKPFCWDSDTTDTDGDKISKKKKLRQNLRNFYVGFEADQNKFGDVQEVEFPRGFVSASEAPLSRQNLLVPLLLHGMDSPKRIRWTSWSSSIGV